MTRKQKFLSFLSRVAAFKVATVMGELLKNDKLPGFNGVIDMVTRVNNMFGEGDHVTAREVAIAVSQNRINEPPQKKDVTRKLPDDAFQAICDAFFTHNALTQHNCERRLQRLQQSALLSNITEPYFRNKGEEGIVDY